MIDTWIEIEGPPPEIVDDECYRSFLSAERSFALAGLSELCHALQSRSRAWILPVGHSADFATQHAGS